MIELTRLNGNRIAVNCDLIQSAESSPDTLLTLVTGEKIIVTESLAEIIDRMAAWRARTLAEAACMNPSNGAAAALHALSATRAVSACGQGDNEEIDEPSAGAMRRRRRAEF